MPRPVIAVAVRANRNVATNVPSACLSVGSLRNQRRNRGENWPLPNWTIISTTDVTKPVKAIMPLPSAASAVLALSALIASVRSQWIALVPPSERDTQRRPPAAHTRAGITHIS